MTVSKIGAVLLIIAVVVLNVKGQGRIPTDGEMAECKLLERGIQTKRMKLMGAYKKAPSSCDITCVYLMTDPKLGSTVEQRFDLDSPDWQNCTVANIYGHCLYGRCAYKRKSDA